MAGSDTGGDDDSRGDEPDGGSPEDEARPHDDDRGDEGVVTAFERTVDEGTLRLQRSWPALLATGAIGGLDVGVGLIALLVVRHATGSELLGALAFPIGFIALSLANSELFTENFLVPVAAVAADQAPARSVLRLWVGTAATNLAGGFVVMGLAMTALPHLHPVALELAVHHLDAGIGSRSFTSALLAGMVITLMTWMEHSTDSVPGKLAAVIAAGFLLAAAPFDHAVVFSLQVFAALHGGAPFGYADWAGSFGWIVLGNMIGGIGLVTVLRLVQVGRHTLEKERARA